MDRIFLNIKTQETLISAKDGVMPISADWIQIGTIDLSKVTRKDFKGSLSIS